MFKNCSHSFTWTFWKLAVECVASTRHEKRCPGTACLMYARPFEGDIHSPQTWTLDICDICTRRPILIYKVQIWPIFLQSNFGICKGASHGPAVAPDTCQCSCQVSSRNLDLLIIGSSNHVMNICCNKSSKLGLLRRNHQSPLWSPKFGPPHNKTTRVSHDFNESTNLALLLFFHQISLGPNRWKIACLTSEQPTELKWPWPRCLWTHWSNPATGCQGSSQTAKGKACKCYQVKPCDMWDFQLQNVTKCKQNTRTYKNHQVMK